MRDRALPLQQFLIILNKGFGSMMMSGLGGGLGRVFLPALLGLRADSLVLRAGVSGQRFERKKTCAAFP